MIVADGGQADGHHLGPEKCRGGRSGVVVRIGGEAGTARARQGGFATLRDAGVTLTGVPEQMGGVWHSGARSTRPTGAIFRTLARLDPSVALVTTMHPTVLALWLEAPVEPPVDPNAWREQRDRVLTAAKAGHWFGTISSEPGGGGDLMATRATAEEEAMTPGA